MNYAKNSNPSSREDLLNFQELILPDIRFLAGCDIHWDFGVPLRRTSDSAAIDATAAADAAAVDAAATDAATADAAANHHPPAAASLTAGGL